MRYTIGQLTVGQILDQSFSLLKNHYKLFLGICGILYFPLILLQGLIIELLTIDASSGPAATAAALERFPILMGVMGIFTVLAMVIVGPLTAAAVTFGVSHEYLDQHTTIKDSIGKAFGKIVPVLLTGILAGIMILLGFMLCLIPGIYLALKYYVVQQVVVLENLSGTAAMKRSGELMKGNMGIAFVLGALVMVISIAAGFFGSLISIPFASSIINAAVQTVTMAFWTIAIVVFYFHCRSNNEAYDLQLLAESVAAENQGYGEAPPPPPLPGAE